MWDLRIPSLNRPTSFREYGLTKSNIQQRAQYVSLKSHFRIRWKLHRMVRPHNLVYFFFTQTSNARQRPTDNPPHFRERTNIL